MLSSNFSFKFLGISQKKFCSIYSLEDLALHVYTIVLWTSVFFGIFNGRNIKIVEEFSKNGRMFVNCVEKCFIIKIIMGSIQNMLFKIKQNNNYFKIKNNFTQSSFWSTSQ